MNEKYELLKDPIINLYRIRALKDFSDIKAGTLGGYVENEDNLSHDGNAWIYGNAKVCGDAKVYGNSRVYDDAKIYGNAEVYGDARVCSNAIIYDDAEVYGNAEVYGDAWVYGNARVYSNARVYGDAEVYGNARVCCNACVYGNTRVYSNARVYGDACLKTNADYTVIHGFGSEERTTTFFRCKDGNIRVNCGCFYGTIDEFRYKVHETHGDSKYAKEYLMIADLMKFHFSE